MNVIASVLRLADASGDCGFRQATAAQPACPASARWARAAAGRNRFLATGLRRPWETHQYDR
ncbi:MAG: hypothetical protein MZV70_50395 [Desulfobacterales bacterium]|nr:hypothetical protein [Desulfobacterales bacterium]